MALMHRKSDLPSLSMFPSDLRRDFERLQREMDQLVSRFGPEDMELEAWNPSVDIYEDDKGLRVKADVPGITPKDIDIKVEGRTLTLSGTREESKEEKKENFQRMERFRGEFKRVFSLPETVDPEKIEASFKNGVLDIFVPVKPGAKEKAKRIEIKTAS